MKKTSTEQKPEEKRDVPEYHRPCRRGEDGKREITVASLLRGHDYRRRGDQRVPYIRMSGVWLERLRFQRGHRVEITAERQRLILTVVAADSELPTN